MKKYLLFDLALEKVKIQTENSAEWLTLAFIPSFFNLWANFFCRDEDEERTENLRRNLFLYLFFIGQPQFLRRVNFTFRKDTENDEEKYRIAKLGTLRIELIEFDKL